MNSLKTYDRLMGPEKQMKYGILQLAAVYKQQYIIGNLS